MPDCVKLEYEKRRKEIRPQWVLQDDVRDAHETVWGYRERLNGHWATPSAWDSFRFAITELGEAVDAELRENEAYTRNNGRERAMMDELADLAMMLLTAAGPTLPEATRYYGCPADMDELAYSMGSAMVTVRAWRGLMKKEDAAPAVAIWPSLYVLADWFRNEGDLMRNAVERRLQRIEAKVKGG